MFVFMFQHLVPVFTLPFTLVTQVIINVSGFRGYLYRVEDMSYPEKQAYDWHTRIKVKTSSDDVSDHNPLNSRKNINKQIRIDASHNIYI